jgi:serine kinase of HPr protein (carbohydrate metabolism regulator)
MEKTIKILNPEHEARAIEALKGKNMQQLIIDYLKKVIRDQERIDYNNEFNNTFDENYEEIDIIIE